MVAPWAVFNNWEYAYKSISSQNNWSTFEPLAPALSSTYATKIKTLNNLLEKWDTKLKKHTIGEKSVSYYPNPKDFNLSRDFNLIIDEFIRIISKKESTL